MRYKHRINGVNFMSNKNSMLKLLAITLFSFVLSACGGAESTKSGQNLLTCDVPMVPNASGDACIAPEPIQCPVPTVPDAKNESCVVGVDPNAPAPVFFPSESQALSLIHI